MKRSNTLKLITFSIFIFIMQFFIFNGMAYAASNYDDITISFNSHGGVGIDSITRKYNSEYGELPIPEYDEYHIFDGWYKEDTYQNKVSSKTKSTEDITLHAKWVDDPFPYVYPYHEEPFVCTGSNYIDTGVALYDSENWEKDYEIGFTIEDYNSNQQSENQVVFVNAKYENESIGWPGLVFRKSGNNLEITQTLKSGSKVQKIFTDYAPGYKVRIYRIDKKVYYSINDGERTLLQNMSTFNLPFDVNTYFCAGDDGNGGVQRFLKGTISNYYVRRGTYQDGETHSVTYPDGTVENYLHNSIINLESNEESKENDILSTVTFKYHDNQTDDTTSNVSKKYIPNGFNINNIHYDDESTLVVDEDKVIEYSYDERIVPATFPSVPERDNYTFDGWYTEEVGGEKVEEYSSLEDITLHAHWTLDLPTDITIDSDNVTLIAGELHQVVVTFTPEGTTDVVTYTGYDNEIISVTDGLITGLSKGTTTITIGTENTDITKEITVTVLSDKLESNVYSVTDKVRPKDDPEEDDVTDRIIIGAEPETLISEFKDNMLNPNEYIKIYDKDGNEVEDSEIVRTGLTIKLEYNGIVLDEASMVVRGDVDEDGFVNVSDYISVLNHALSLETVEDYISFAAGDVEEDNMLNVSDYIKIMDYALRNIDSINN